MIEEMRNKITNLDKDILLKINERIALGKKVNDIKKDSGLPIMQPERVKTVLNNVADKGLELGLDAEFVRKVWALFIEEVCTVSLNDNGSTLTTDERLTKDSQTDSLIDQVTISIDHVAIAVHCLEDAIDFFRNTLGFSVVDKIEIEGVHSGMSTAVVKAGGVKFVIVQATNQLSNVAKYINAYGAGVQHIALQVNNIGLLKLDLDERGFDVLGDIIRGKEIDQLFSKRNKNSGIQLEFIERYNDGFSQENVQKLFSLMEKEDVY